MQNKLLILRAGSEIRTPFSVPTRFIDENDPMTTSIQLLLLANKLLFFNNFWIGFEIRGLLSVPEYKCSLTIEMVSEHF